jgi:hypothetical protein
VNILTKTALDPPAAFRHLGPSRSKALQTGICGRDYINMNFAQVRKRSEMPLQLTLWCLQLLVALGKAGP